MSFLTKVAKLPVQLAVVVTYALVLGLSRGLGKYLMKDGNGNLIGNTTFLVTMYGRGKLNQVFCWSGEVF